jgi:Fur family transcriptional regulator, ferric uptake regulator
MKPQNPRRNTRQREAIRDVLLSANRPLAPQEVVGLVRSTVPSLGIATVYRTLKEYVEDGWLVPITVAGSIRYELAQMEHHHHFYCRSCDKTYSLPGCTGELSRLLPSGFVMSSHDLTINGLCPSCSEAPSG